MTAAAATRLDACDPDARVAGARVGDLFAKHGRMVFAICRAILRDPDEAEDATQSTFLAAHEAFARGVVVRDPGAWLATIARNECRSRISTRRADPLPLRVEELAGAVTTDDELERRATVSHLRKAIAALPEKQREAVILRDLYGLRYGEISVALGLSRPSVEALLFRARRTLRVRLRPVGGVVAVPLGVREGLAQAIPGFGQEVVAGAAGAAAGAGLLGKLGGATAAKVAVGAVAVGLTGSAVIEHDRGALPTGTAGVKPADAREVRISGPASASPAARRAARSSGDAPTPTTRERTPVAQVAAPPAIRGIAAQPPPSGSTRDVSRQRTAPERSSTAPAANRGAGQAATAPARTAQPRSALEPAPAPPTRPGLPVTPPRESSSARAPLAATTTSPAVPASTRAGPQSAETESPVTETPSAPSR